MAGTRDALDSMAPWDAAPYFQAPTQTIITFTGPGSSSKLLIGADPMRIGLIFSSAGGTGVVISMVSDLSLSGGFLMSNSKPPLQLLFSEVGPLVQVEWWGNASGPGSVTVYAISLAKWPKVGDGRLRSANASKPDQRNRNRR